MRLETFIGRWAIARAIEDMRLGRGGRFEGEARFAPGAAGLDYLEEGTIRLDGAGAFQASRRYLWLDGGRGMIEVRFADARFFHRFDADAPRPGATHDCPPDHYRVRYDFRAWPRWRAEWWVRGPAKDYRLVSDYRPAGQAG